ncbi:PhoX family phosphatase [Intrasporangium sp. YIM S08009]|uniref:PhoX family protein n=1 Tax=Intrasporangium zincisolvens TaxID=3080018 RepID=UPI002B05BACB|nr:PhoX family phosphatase [Intrasporangium sp. YIM S08009]
MTPQLLPLVSTPRHGSRSRMTCHYRCNSACDAPVPNESGNASMHDLVEGALARRSVLKGSALGAGALVLAGLAAGPAAPAAASSAPAGKGHGRPTGDVGRAAFTPVTPNNADAVTNAPEYTQNVVIRWGDPVEAGAPRFDVHAQTPEAQARQFGYNNDYVGVLPLDGKRALLVTNHEYTDENLMFPTGEYDDATVKKIAMAAHGMAVVTIERGRAEGSWVRADHRRAKHNRRITVHTEFAFHGPAAGHELLRTAADPTGTRVHGTFGNCAGGTTPWGTVLSGEENFNGYFDASGAVDPANAASFKRYGIPTSAVTNRGWSSVDERFDLAKHPHEAYRFGWVVEVDPFEPDSTPVKQTMLGRFKHEGANVTISDSGHAVAYMGDDERGDYIYKFVSADRFREGPSRTARRHNKTLLTRGTLYVAKFAGDGTADGVYDGTGEWIALTSHERSFVPGMSVGDVLVHTRLAADTVGPTKMDRPEDIEPNPVNGRIYCALTNNSNRGTSHPVDEANPLASSMVRASLGAPLTSKSGNRNGYVLEVTENRGDHTGTAFTWDLFLVCGDPEAPETYFAGFDKARVSPISCPDNVAFDGVGNLWISTDGNVLGSNDGLFRVPVAGPDRGRVEQFLTVPVGAETCGPLVTEDQRSVFIAVQHPGETDGATFEKPSSTWPHTDGFPRPAVVVSYRK